MQCHNEVHLLYRQWRLYVSQEKDAQHAEAAEELCQVAFEQLLGLGTCVE